MNFRHILLSLVKVKVKVESKLIKESYEIFLYILQIIKLKFIYLLNTIFNT